MCLWQFPWDAFNWKLNYEVDPGIAKTRCAMCSDTNGFRFHGGGPDKIESVRTFFSDSKPLVVGERLVAENQDFWLALEEDGDIMIFRTTLDNKAIWSSRGTRINQDRSLCNEHTFCVHSFFLAVQRDSNLGVFPGFGGDWDTESPIWKTESKVHNDNDFYVVMQNNGKLGTHRGAGPDDDRGLVRRMRPRYIPMDNDPSLSHS